MFLVGSIYLFIVSRPVGTHIGYILTITALRLTACTVFLKVSPLRGDYRSPLYNICRVLSGRILATS